MFLAPLFSSFRKSPDNAGTQAAEEQAKDPPKAEDAAKQVESAENISQCGLEDDGEQWEQWTPPPRPKTTLLNEEEQKKFRAHLQKLFSDDTLLGVRLAFEPKDVREILVKTREILKYEPMLIEDVPCGITVVGDLHGQLYDLDRIFSEDESRGKKGWECMRYLFLGNYVDSGRQSYEIVMALFILKCLYPDRIFLLRGNHEFIETNLRGGFLEEIEDRYEHKGQIERVFTRINEIFNYLSVAAIVGNTYYCANGGISPVAFTRQQMRGLVKPYVDGPDDILVQNVVWSDPAEGLRGSAFNVDRGRSHFYGFDVMCHALHTMQVKGVIRGHSFLAEGFNCAWNVLFSLFSATDYKQMRNKGATIYIGPTGKLTINSFDVDQGRSEWEARRRPKKDAQPDQKTDKNQDGDGNKKGQLKV